ncbi:branched-chain amino acid ABC transporter permease [Neobacillus sp. 114]|uniref:branched-chain amino acid ABC transporter permease n=1 Tax=Neobacillus sp. 114 TaxID=3048535 RepID=UPI0024C3CBD1|nr:branched-chain amino acid ABC transporter permease [Neobacillus sp. 114]
MSDLFIQLLVNGIALGTQIGLVSVGFALIFGVTKTMHLSHGAIITLSGYFLYVCTGVLGLPLILAFLISGLVGGAAGLANELIIYEPIRKRPFKPFIIVVASLGTGIILENTLGLIFGRSVINIRESTIGSASNGIDLFGASIAATDILTILITIVMLVLLESSLRFTKLGRAIRCVMDNPSLAKVLGINSRKIYLLTFFIGSFVSAPAAFFISLNSGLYTTVGFEAMLIAFIAAFVGGIGSLNGAFLGGLIIGIVQNLGLLVIDSQWKLTLAFFVLFIIVLIKPTGLFGNKIGNVEV